MQLTILFDRETAFCGWFHGTFRETDLYQRSEMSDICFDELKEVFREQAVGLIRVGWTCF
jgi:hypothetical protein